MECPTCRTVLSTERGMRRHHATVHGDPLPNRTCKGCGTEFYDPKSQRSYCEDCDPNAGRNNGNWTGARETTTCEKCGDEFGYYPSDKDGIYCSGCFESGNGLDELGPDEYSDRVELECEQFGTAMTEFRSRVERDGVRFCTRECHGEWMSENRVGENHHHWEDEEVDYTGAWWRVRRKALERDDRRRQNCGRDEDDLGKTPDVHHVEPVREFEDPQDAHSLDNVVVLCRSCHRYVEEGTIQLPDHDVLGK